MPTYVYLCTDCAHEFELVQRITEEPAKDCPACKKQTAKRQLQAGNFILKGGGWYSDLYSGGSNRKEGESTAASANASGDGAKAGSASSEKPAGGKAESSTGSSASEGAASSSTAASSGSSGGSSPSSSSTNSNASSGS